MRSNWSLAPTEMMFGRVVARGVKRLGVRVREVVARGRDEELAARVRQFDRIPERLREVTAAPGVVHDRDALRACVEDRADGVLGRPGSTRVEELERHDRAVPGDAGHADAVVAGRGDRPRDVRSVAVVVRRVVVVVHEVPAAPVVDVAVAVVVEAVRPAARAVLALVDPDVLGEIGVRHVDTGVDDRDGDVGASGGDGPRLLRVDVRIGRAGRVVHRLASCCRGPSPAGRTGRSGRRRPRGG